MGRFVTALGAASVDPQLPELQAGRWPALDWNPIAQPSELAVDRSITSPRPSGPVTDRPGPRPPARPRPMCCAPPSRHCGRSSTGRPAASVPSIWPTPDPPAASVFLTVIAGPSPPSRRLPMRAVRSSWSASLSPPRSGSARSTRSPSMSCRICTSRCETGSSRPRSTTPTAPPTCTAGAGPRGRLGGPYRPALGARVAARSAHGRTCAHRRRRQRRKR